MNPGNTLTSYFFKILSNIILSSVPRFSYWSLAFKFLHPTTGSCPITRIEILYGELNELIIIQRLLFSWMLGHVVWYMETEGTSKTYLSIYVTSTEQDIVAAMLSLDFQLWCTTCLNLGRASTKLTKVFGCFSVPPHTFIDSTSIKAQLLSSKSSTVHHSPINLPFIAIQCRYW
jgi:hypothetical protein